MILCCVVRGLPPVTDHLLLEGFGTLLEGGRRKHRGDNGGESSDNCCEIGRSSRRSAGRDEIPGRGEILHDFDDRSWRLQRTDGTLIKEVR